MSAIRQNDIINSYRIYTDEYTYILTCRKKSDDSFVFKLGGPKNKDCITITTHGDGPYKNIAMLPHVRKESSCAVNKPFTSGTHIIYTAFSFIKGLPHIDYIELNDVSNISCVNGKDISLACFYFVQYQQTWYEKHFGAEIKNDLDRETYLTLKEDWNKPEMKIPPADFKNNLTDDWNIPLDRVNKLIPLYERTATYKEFFDKVFATYGKFESCILLQHWIDSFMSSILHFSFYNRTWRISTKIMKTIPIMKVEKIQAGGYRAHTRKQIRKQRNITPSYLGSYNWTTSDV